MIQAGTEIQPWIELSLTCFLNSELDPGTYYNMLIRIIISQVGETRTIIYGIILRVAKSTLLIHTFLSVKPFMNIFKIKFNVKNTRLWPMFRR